MISTGWLERRKPHWERLEALVASAAAGGLRSLTREDLKDLGLLYRQVAADLAAIREDPTSVHFARYLNQLLSRAHNTIYAAERSRPLAALGFFRHAFPVVFRRNLACSLLAFSVFAAAAGIGVATCLHDPDFASKILGPQMMDTIRRRQMWTHSILTIKPVASTAIATNNLSVSFITFALGITGGLGTLYMMALNGLMLGVVATACATAGMSLALWSFVAPHGVLELPAVFIAGGAGLRLAQGLLFPGLLPRRASLAEGGSEAVKMVLGCIPILIVAGVIEAFVSPTELATPLKFGMAAALALLLAAYLFGTRNEGPGTKPGASGTRD
jgi:uncharacterized membrane protein SpoIIM required for sporulation